MTYRLRACPKCNSAMWLDKINAEWQCISCGKFIPVRPFAPESELRAEMEAVSSVKSQNAKKQPARPHLLDSVDQAWLRCQVEELHRPVPAVALELHVAKDTLYKFIRGRGITIPERGKHVRQVYKTRAGGQHTGAASR